MFLCLFFFDFLYLEKLKSTCKHVVHCSHHSLSDVIWSVFVFWTRILWHWKKIIKKLMTIFFFYDFFKKLKILVILINWELISAFVSWINSCFVIHISDISWINNRPAARSIEMKFNFLQRHICTYLIC